MNFIVLLKQVPDTTSIPAEAWDQEKGTLRRGVLDNVLNAHDLHALTFACNLRKAASPEGKVVCLTMGISSASEVLLDAMARGADEGILLTDAAFAGADTAATARSIELAVRKIEAEVFGGDRQYIVVAGMQSVDGDTAQVPPQLAEALGIDLVAYITDLKMEAGAPLFVRIGPQGVETVRPTSYPVLATLTDCTLPLYPSFERARKVRRSAQPYRTWNAAQVGADAREVGGKGSRTQVVKLFSPKSVQKDCLYVKEPAELLPAIREKLRTAAAATAGAKTAYRPTGERSYRGEIWVYAESHDGRLSPAACELIGKAHELAAVLGEKVGAVLTGKGVRPLADAAVACGADTVYVADDPRLETYNSVAYGSVVSQLVTKHRPAIMLFGATPLGRELAPRVAYATASGLTADCTQLDIGDHAGQTAILLQTRPALGGNIMATIVSKNSLTQMATVRPGVFASPAAAVAGGTARQAVIPNDSVLPHTDSQKELRAATREYARQKFSGRDRVVETPALGGSVEITRGGIEKATSHFSMTREQFLSVTVVDELLRNATLRSSQPDRHGRPNVRLVHTLDSSVIMDGKVYPVKIVVLETTNGRKYYDQHTVITDEALAGDSGIAGLRRAEVRPSANASSTDIIGGNGPEVKPGGEELSQRIAARRGTIVAFDGTIACGSVQVVSVAPAAQRKSLAGAQLIVAGGAGLRKAEHFRQYLGPLATALGNKLGFSSIIGASRRAVERALATRDQQVGQTGQTVEPELYVAVAISGAVQHISGMQKSKVVVAINSDPKAPIFRIADIAMVGKAEKVLPALLEELGK